MLATKWFTFRSEFDEIIVKASINGKEVSRERVVKETKKDNQDGVSGSSLPAHHYVQTKDREVISCGGYHGS